MTTSISMTQDEAYSIINKFVAEMDSVITTSKDGGGNRIEQVNSIFKELSLEHAFIRLWLDWDYQVCNGGVTQYTGNGYHSTMQSGCMGNTSDEDDVHQELVRLTEEFLKSNPVKLGDTFLSIIKDFKITLDDEYMIEESCNSCGGSGTTSEWDEEADEEVDSECSNCGGTGEEEIHNESYNEPDYNTESLFEKLDKRYYAINDELMFQIAEVLNS